MQWTNIAGGGVRCSEGSIEVGVEWFDVDGMCQALKEMAPVLRVICERWQEPCMCLQTILAVEVGPAFPEGETKTRPGLVRP
jgi:hypothetical protein